MDRDKDGYACER
ncbi:excalibur calcium-binding domain-containing protein [Peribacillus asahii]|nr:excalibur calcium-binding domain-containing protein [Peribacillus asahii]